MKKHGSSFASHVYGPVPSRRLGFSLGVDILPFKTCSLDCIYCQLGASNRPTVRRGSFVEVADVLAQIGRVVESGKKIDFITFSGSGEPTLNTQIGALIEAIKKNFSLPVAVLTNSTLLTRKSVRDALRRADLVIPSLDAATQSVFRRINRPCEGVSLSEIIQGLKEFKKSFSGEIWLEIMLVKGVNDSDAHLRKLAQVVREIDPDKIQLNTVVRPPAVTSSDPLSLEEMKHAQKVIGLSSEIVADFGRGSQKESSSGLDSVILAIVQRRPITASEAVRVSGKKREDVLASLDHLSQKGFIRSVSHGKRIYYEACEGTGSTKT